MVSEIWPETGKSVEIPRSVDITRDLINDVSTHNPGVSRKSEITLWRGRRDDNAKRTLQLKEDEE